MYIYTYIYIQISIFRCFGVCQCVLACGGVYRYVLVCAMSRLRVYITDKLELWEGVLRNVTGWGCGGVTCSRDPRTVTFQDTESFNRLVTGQRVAVTPSIMQVCVTVFTISERTYGLHNKSTYNKCKGSFCMKYNDKNGRDDFA